MEKSKPLNFSAPELEEPLKEKRVTSTIRGVSFIKRFGFKQGDHLEIKYKRERVGFAFITSISSIGFKDLYDPIIVEKEGFNKPEELIKFLSRMQWRFHMKKIKEGKLKIPFIEFEWVDE